MPEKTGTWLDDIPEELRPKEPEPGPSLKTGTYLDDLPANARPQILPHWDDVADEYKKKYPGLDPKAMQEQYDQARSQAVERTLQGGRLQSARERLAGQEETRSSWLSRRAIPVVSSFIISPAQALEYHRAKKRLDAREPRPEDYQTIAGYERGQQLDEEAEQTWSGAAANALARVPAMAGEALAGGAVLKGMAAAAPRALGFLAPQAAEAAGVTLPKFLSVAGLAQATGRTAATTALMPSMYVEQWAHNNMEHGRDPLNPKGFPAAFATGMIQTAILGSLSNQVTGLPYVGKALAGEGVLPFAGRQVAKGVIGAGEQAGADLLAGPAQDIVKQFLPEWVPQRTSYGTIGELLEGKGGDALRHATIGALTFAAFGAVHEGIHGTPAQQRTAQAMEAQALDHLASYQQALARMAKRGMSGEGAGRNVTKVFDVLQQHMEENPNPTRAEVTALFEAMPDSLTRDDGFDVAKSFPTKRIPLSQEAPPFGPHPGTEGPVPSFAQENLARRRLQEIKASQRQEGQPEETARGAGTGAAAEKLETPITQENIRAEQLRRRTRGLRPATPEEIAAAFVLDPQARHVERARRLMGEASEQAPPAGPQNAPPAPPEAQGRPTAPEVPPAAPQGQPGVEPGQPNTVPEQSPAPQRPAAGPAAEAPPPGKQAPFSHLAPEEVQQLSESLLGKKLRTPGSLIDALKKAGWSEGLISDVSEQSKPKPTSSAPVAPEEAAAALAEEQAKGPGLNRVGPRGVTEDTDTVKSRAREERFNELRKSGMAEAAARQKAEQEFPRTPIGEQPAERPTTPREGVAPPEPTAGQAGRTEQWERVDRAHEKYLKSGMSAEDAESAARSLANSIGVKDWQPAGREGTGVGDLPKALSLKRTWASRATETGIDPEDLHGLAQEIGQHDKQAVARHNSLLAELRETLKSYDPQKKGRKLTAEKYEDEAAVHRLDEAVTQYEYLLTPLREGNERPAETAFRLLKEGNQKPMTQDKLYWEAFQQLRERLQPTYQEGLFGGATSIAKQKGMFGAEEFRRPAEPVDERQQPLFGDEGNAGFDPDVNYLNAPSANLARLIELGKEWFETTPRHVRMKMGKQEKYHGTERAREAMFRGSPNYALEGFRKLYTSWGIPLEDVFDAAELNPRERHLIKESLADRPVTKIKFDEIMLKPDGLPVVDASIISKELRKALDRLADLTPESIQEAKEARPLKEQQRQERLEKIQQAKEGSLLKEQLRQEEKAARRAERQEASSLLKEQQRQEREEAKTARQAEREEAKAARQRAAESAAALPEPPPPPKVPPLEDIRRELLEEPRLAAYVAKRDRSGMKALTDKEWEGLWYFQKHARESPNMLRWLEDADFDPGSYAKTVTRVPVKKDASPVVDRLMEIGGGIFDRKMANTIMLALRKTAGRYEAMLEEPRIAAYVASRYLADRQGERNPLKGSEWESLKAMAMDAKENPRLLDQLKEKDFSPNAYHPEILKELRRRQAAGEPVTQEEVFDAAGLTPRERHVIIQRGAGRSFEDIAGDAEMQVKRQYVNEVEQEARAKLRMEESMANTAIKALKIDSIIERKAQGKLVRPTELHVDPEEVKSRNWDRLNLEVSIDHEMTALSKKYIKEANRGGGELGEERSAWYQAEFDRLTKAKKPGPEQEAWYEARRLRRQESAASAGTDPAGAGGIATADQPVAGVRGRTGGTVSDPGETEGKYLRAPQAGEGTKPGEGTREGMDPFRIIETIKNLFKLPAYGGGEELRYNLHAEAAEVPSMRAGDARYITHEMAHHLAKTQALPLDPAQLSKDVAEGFKQFDYEPGRSDPKKAMQEGFAEWLRLRTTDGLKDLSPEQTAAADYAEKMFQSRPELLKKLDRVKDLFQKFNAQDPLQKAAGLISATGKTAEPVLQPGEKIQGWWQRFKDYWADSVTNRLAVLQRAGMDRAYLVYSRLMHADKPIAERFGQEGIGTIEDGKWTVIGPSDARIKEGLLPEDLQAVPGHGVSKAGLFAIARDIISAADKPVKAGERDRVAVSAEQLQDYRDAMAEMRKDPEFVKRATQFADRLTEGFNASRRALASPDIGYLDPKKVTKAGIPLDRVRQEVGLKHGARETSGEQVIDPLLSYEKRKQVTASLLNEQLRRRAVQDYLDQEGMGKWGLATKEAGEKPEGKVTLEQSGLKDSEVESLLKDMGADAAYFRQTPWKKDGSRNGWTVKRNGQDVTYAIHDKALFDLITGQQGDANSVAQFFHWMGKLGFNTPWGRVEPLRQSAELVRAGATKVSLGFQVRNALVPSRDPYEFAKNTIDQASIGRLPEALARAYSFEWAVLRGDIPKDVVFSLFARERGRQLRQFAQKEIKEVRGPLDLVSQLFNVAGAGELGPRFLEFTNRMKQLGWTEAKIKEAMAQSEKDAQAGKPRQDPIAWDTIQDAMNAAAEVTVPFERKGVVTTEINKLVPFFGPAVAGMSKALRNWQTNTRGAAIALGGYLTLRLMHWLANKDEDWYRELSDHDRYGNFVVKIPGLGLRRIPGARDLEVPISGALISMLDAASGKNPRLAGLMKESVGAVAPPAPVPPVAKVAFELQGNKNWMGTPIVPRREEDLPAMDKATQYQIPYAAQQLTGGRGELSMRGSGLIPFSEVRPHQSVAEYNDRLHALTAQRKASPEVKRGMRFPQEAEYQRLHAIEDKMSQLSMLLRGERKVGAKVIQGQKPSEERAVEIRRIQTELARRALGGK